MPEMQGLRVAVTGAAGFIGRAVVHRICAGALGTVGTLRLNDVQPLDHDSASFVTGSYADACVRDRLLDGGIDVLFHLASLPGGASARDPALGRQVNLDGSLALLDSVSGAHGPVVVYTSSIAALGRCEQTVTDSTVLNPSGSYGTHKAMIELYAADLARRGLIDARCVRPAGIVARPHTAFSGFATAWMSDLFHAAREGRAISIPSRPDARIWLQSIDTVADNIIHAALLPKPGLDSRRTWTLPATVVQVSALVEALQRATGRPLDVTYGDGPTDQPQLDARSALDLGFVDDGDADRLVARVLAQISAD